MNDIRKKRDRVWKKLCRVHDGFMIVILCAVMLVSGYCLYDNWVILSRADGGDLLQYKPDSTSDGAESPITDGMVGWITIDGTSIDYPVMQGESNLTFLSRDPYGRFSLSGSIFLDSRSSPDFSDGYSMIYGHHMEYGRMFGALDAFLDRDYAAAHRHGTLLVGRDGSRRMGLTVFAVLRADAGESAVFDMEGTDDAPQPATAAAFIDSHALFRLGAHGNRILALSTCDGESDSSRIIVVCSVS